MNILLISDFFFPNIGGIEVHVLSLALYFQSIGHCPVVLTRSHPPNYSGFVLLFDKLPCYYLPFLTVFGVSLPSRRSLFKQLSSISTKHRIDLIHLHQCFSPLSLLSCSLKKSLNVPFVFTHHSIVGFEFASFYFMKILFRSVFSCVDRFIAVSKISSRNLKQLLPSTYNNENISIIPAGGIDESKFFTNYNQVKTNNISIVCMLRMTKRKGARLVYSVIKSILKHYNNLNVLIVGNGPYFEQINELGGGNNVTIIEGVLHAEVPTILRSSDIFLSTSLTEAFGISILEALSCGCTVVSTPAGILDHLSDSLLSRVFKTDCEHESIVKSLCNAIDSCMNQRNSRNNYVSSCNNLLNEFSWSFIGNSTLKVYESCLVNKKTVIKRSQKPLLSLIVISFLLMVGICLHSLSYC
ncbi:hypothetical protein RCL1_000691 [Eukaryota sp. TZLM3-RCL]